MYYAYGCPGCRAARVAKAFAPVDPLRTALGIERLSSTVSQIDKEYYHGTPRWSVRDNEVEQVQEAERDDPKFYIPVGEVNQVYQLRRMFRL